MPTAWTDLAAATAERLSTGRRIDAWKLLQPSWQEGFAVADPDFLRAAHETCRWLGFDTRRQWLQRRIWQQHRLQPWAWPIRILDLVRRGRLLPAWEATRDPARPAATDPDHEAAFQIAVARTLLMCRDFVGSADALARAAATGGDDHRVARERAWLAFEQDDLDRAFALVHENRQRWPAEPTLREQECWFLLQRGDRRDALQALADAAPHVDCPSFRLLHADALVEAGDLAEARRQLERVAHDGLYERHQLHACHMLLARVLRTLGDDRAALAAMRQAGPRMAKWADRLAAFLAAPDRAGTGRVVVPVPFVRQDHVTCSPATMASLLAAQGLPIDQREIAAQITYDGTPSHQEMVWAEQRDLAIHFFLWDPAVARQLLDRGLPFAVSTRYEQSGHRQAVVGYDLALDTFVLRDPGTPFLREVDAGWLTHNLVSRGGDCALLLTRAHAGRLGDLALPHATAARQLQELRFAYHQRDLPRAAALATALLAGPPSSVRWEAECAIAHEHGDRRRQLELWQAAYAQLPDDAYWQYHLALELRNQDRWGPFVALLQRHQGSRRPYLDLLLAEHLRHAGATRDAAERLARRAASMLPQRGGPIRLCADILWEQPERRSTATELYLLAACLEPFHDGYAYSYFVACRHLGQTERGLQFLRDRVARLGARDAGPGNTLASALDTLHRRSEAIATLRQALANRDHEGAREQLFDLLLADGQRDAAQALLDEQPERWRPATLCKHRHRLARANGDPAAALAALTAGVAAAPSDPSLRLLHLRELLATAGRDAALAAAEGCVAEHGDDPLLLIRVQEFYDEIHERAAAEALLRRLCAEHPAEWWLLGRLCRCLIRNGRAAEAEPHLATLLQQTPDSLAVWLDAIDCAEEQGQLELARQRAAAALQRWASEPAVLQRWRGLADSAATSRQGVEQALAALLASHVPPDDGELGTIVAAAERDLGEAAVPPFLASLQERFPGDPGVAATRCRWLLEHQPQDAVPLAEQLVADFPWLLDHTLLLARCLSAVQRRAEARQQLEALLARAPGFAQAWVDLGESFEQESHSETALATYERGLAQVPQFAILHGMRASLLWTIGDQQAALAAVERAVTLDPAYAWARRAQVLWYLDTDRQDEALAAATGCVRDNPSWSTAHELLAAAHEKLGNHDERIAALEQALRCDPRLGGARLRLIDALLDLRRFPAAEAVIAAGLALLGDDPRLRLARLRIQRQQGDLVGAREGLRALLAEHADFETGWTELLGWLDEERLDDEILSLAQTPPAALADNPTLPGYAAEVCRRAGDRHAAKKHLQRALEQAPDYDWARDQLADVLLELDQPRTMLQLYPGDDAARMPFRRAARVARAAAATGDADRAERFFARLLREPEADAVLLEVADQALRRHQRRRHQRHLQGQLEQSSQQQDGTWHENTLTVLATRSDRSLWRRLVAMRRWLPADEVELRTARLLYVAHKAKYATRTLLRWVERHVQPPLADVEAWGRTLFSLSGKRGSRLAVRLTAGDYRRQGVRGWMLANLVGSHADLHQWDEVVAIAEFALSEVPRDHSFWWHRRYLAEAAYHRGDLARCRELCAMPTEEYPTVKVRCVQFDLLAAMAGERSWRTRRWLLQQNLAELLRQAELADLDNRGGRNPIRLEWWQFVKLLPTPTTLLLGLGRFGRRLLRQTPAGRRR